MWRIQSVLPGATATEIGLRAGTPSNICRNDIVMRTDDMVDAALAGLDQGDLTPFRLWPATPPTVMPYSGAAKLAAEPSRKTPAARYRARARGVTAAVRIGSPTI